MNNQSETNVWDEKRNIYLPRRIIEMLEKDMEMFDFYKRGTSEFMRNKFLNQLIQGYYDLYLDENNEQRSRILSALRNLSLPDNVQEGIVNALMKEDLEDGGKRGERGSGHVSLKPTGKTRAIMQGIYTNVEDYTSQYLRRMIISYCKKPFFERERIVLRELYVLLKECCEERRILLITTKGSPNKVREIVPYSVTMGTEEMYLYLLCQEEDEVNHRMKAGVYALHHIENVSFGRSNGVLEPQIKTWLDCMTKKGPQYSINEDTEICVRLNDKGVKDYRKIYFGRPQCDEVRVENGYHYLIYRNCSMNQLYLYYRRFDPDNAEIIAPNELRERMHEFFLKGESTYKAAKGGNTGTERDEHE